MISCFVGGWNGTAEEGVLLLLIFILVKNEFRRISVAGAIINWFDRVYVVSVER